MSKATLRVVIINDDPNDASKLRDLLQQDSGHQYSFELADTGASGLEACLSSDAKNVDCVIVDLHLPDMSGIDVIQRLQDEIGEVRFPVVLFIDSGEECKAASAALRAGAQDYISKSWLTADGLACAVEHAIERTKVRNRLRVKRAALERQNREIRTLVDDAPDLIARFDTSKNYTYINPAAKNATGIAPEAFLGKKSQELGLPADVCEIWDAGLDLTLKAKQQTTIEYELHSSAGLRRFQARIVPQFSETGEVEAILAISTDVTRLKRAEEALRSSEAHVRDVIDRILAFVGVMTPDGVLIEANKPALELGSLKPEVVLGTTLQDTYWCSHSPRVQEQIHSAVNCAARGDTVRFDVEIRAEDHRFVTMDLMIAPLLDSRGNVSHLIASGVDITERKRSEGAIRQIAKRERERSTELRAVLKTTPAAIWITKDRNCRRIIGNPAAYKLVGAPEKTNVSASADESELSRRTFQEYANGVPVPASELPMQRAARGIESQGAELTLKLNDGTERHLYGNAVPLQTPDGIIYGAISAFIDITSIKQAEDAVRASEERYRLASEAVSGVIYDWDPRSGSVDRSAGLHELIGFRPDEAEPTRQWWRDRVHPDDLDLIEDRYRSQTSTHEGYQEAEYRIRHRDGSYRHVWDRARVVYGADGQPSRVVGYSIDITERVKWEEALRLSERRFKRFAGSNIIGILFSGFSGEIKFANDEYLRIIGYSREEFEASPPLWNEITPPRWRPADERGISEAQTTGSCTPYEKEYMRRDGTTIPILIGYTVLDETCDELVAFVLDLTERKRSEEVLRELDKRKNEFLAMLAHELRNPLAAIRTAVHVLLLKGPALPELKWGNEVIERQAKHLTRLIEDLLDVSRISSGKIQLKPVPIDAREVVSWALDSVWPLMTAKRHELEINLPAVPMMTLIDPARLQQVLSNILTNAAKYTENHGVITLTGSHEGADIVIRLRDNGIGITPEMLPHIFELHTQVDGSPKRSLGGLGIGLTLVKLIVELHHGQVSAESDGPGLGCEFTIRLPALQDTTEFEADSSFDRQRLAGPWRPRVLVVDADVGMALGLAMLIETSGYEVKTAHEWEAAWALATEFRPLFALIDVGSAVTRGVELAQAFRADGMLQSTKLIAISDNGLAQTSDREQFKLFDRHMLKPLDLQLFLSFLDSWASATTQERTGTLES